MTTEVVTLPSGVEGDLALLPPVAPRSIGLRN
jgi:hypothetical protein